MLNVNLKRFKKLHREGKNQLIYYSCISKNDFQITNLIDNFLNEKNSFIFESVEKGKIRGRYTIFGKNPDKIWEFNEKKIYLIQNKIKQKIKGNPYFYLQKLVKDFNFPTPKNLPKICSLLVGYFSYDIIRYIEKIPDNCKDDLNIPDIRLMRPKTIIIHDNLLKKIYFIVNCFADEKITNYEKYYYEQKRKIYFLNKQSFAEIKNKISKKK